MCVDLAKVFAIVFMVAVHTMMYGGGNFDSTLGFLVDWVFGSPQLTVATTLLSGFCLLVVSILLARVRPFSKIKF